MNEAEIRAHIEWLLSVIANFRQAISMLSIGTKKSYSLNTGQTTESVTQKDLNNLRIQLKEYLSDLQTYREMIGEYQDQDGGEIIMAL